MQNFSLRLKYSENSGDSYTIWVHILGGTLGHLRVVWLSWVFPMYRGGIQGIKLSYFLKNQTKQKHPPNNKTRMLVYISDITLKMAKMPMFIICIFYHTNNNKKEPL